MNAVVIPDAESDDPYAVYISRSETCTHLQSTHIRMEQMGTIKDIEFA